MSKEAIAAKGPLEAEVWANFGKLVADMAEGTLDAGSNCVSALSIRFILQDLDLVPPKQYSVNPEWLRHVLQGAKFLPKSYGFVEQTSSVGEWCCYCGSKLGVPAEDASMKKQTLDKALRENNRLRFILKACASFLAEHAWRFRGVMGSAQAKVAALIRVCQEESELP